MTRLLPILTEAEKIQRLRSMGLSADLIPLNLTQQEREAAQEPSMINSSPTGEAVISGQALFLKVAAVVVALAGAVIAANLFPETTLDEKICGLVIAVGSALGIASPGVRRKE